MSEDEIGAIFTDAIDPALCASESMSPLPHITISLDIARSPF